MSFLIRPQLGRSLSNDTRRHGRERRTGRPRDRGAIRLGKRRSGSSPAVLSARGTAAVCDPGSRGGRLVGRAWRLQAQRGGAFPGRTRAEMLTRRGAQPVASASLLLLTLLGDLGSMRRADAARQCYELCMEIDPVTNQFTGEIYDGAEAFCCTKPAGCGNEGTYSGRVPYGYMEDLRCIAAMRKEPLEVYKWGRIPPKPDDRTLSEKIEGLEYGIRNRMCCKVNACSITDFRDCRRQRAADLEALLAGRRLEGAEEEYLLEEQQQAAVLDRLRQEISEQEHR